MLESFLDRFTCGTRQNRAETIAADQEPNLLNLLAESKRCSAEISTCSLWDVQIDKWRLNKNGCEAVNDSCRKCSFISQWIWKCGRHTLLAAGSLFTSVEQLQNVHYIFIHLYTTLWSVSSSIEDIFPHSDLYSFVKTGLHLISYRGKKNPSDVLSVVWLRFDLMSNPEKLNFQLSFKTSWPSTVGTTSVIPKPSCWPRFNILKKALSHFHPGGSQSSQRFLHQLLYYNDLSGSGLIWASICSRYSPLFPYRVD